MSIDYIFLTQINILSCTFVYCFTGAIFCNTNKRFNKTQNKTIDFNSCVTDVVKFVSKYHTMMFRPLRLLVNHILYIDWQTRMGGTDGGFYPCNPECVFISNTCISSKFPTGILKFLSISKLSKEHAFS